MDFFFENPIQKSKVVESNRLEQRQGLNKLGPDLGSSLFATVQKY